jgi:hypothetical protein
MRRFLNNLFRDFRTTSTAPGGRRAPRRATLTVEGLEDRLVMTSASHLGSSLLVNASQISSMVSQTQPIVRTGSLTPTTTASQNGSTLTIVAASDQITYMKSDGHGHIALYAISAAPTTELAQFNISSINTVNITGLGSDSNGGCNVEIDDSNGMPFAPGTTISLSGSGTTPANVLLLEGSRTLSCSETYVPGSNHSATLSLHHLNVKFVLNSSFGGGITDDFLITGTLGVLTSATQMQLNSYGDQYLSGLGNGADFGLYYSGKPSVTLDAFAPNASIFLDAPDAAPGLSYFTVNMHAAAETTTLDQTPKNVVTVVNVDPPATNAYVALWGNFGPVIIDGDSSTGVSVGYPLNSTGSITSGIEANVTVEGASYLTVNNTGNTSAFENLTVTDNTISGLFANSAVTLEYGGIPSIYILAGHSSMTIFSNSSMAVQVDVDVNSASPLNLTLNFRAQDQAVLDVTSTGTVHLPGTLPNGTIDVVFGGLATSQISYNGFAKVSEMF